MSLKRLNLKAFNSKVFSLQEKLSIKNTLEF